MFLLVTDDALSTGNHFGELLVGLLGVLLAALHELDGKGNAEYRRHEQIEPYLQAARLHVTVGMLLPEIIMFFFLSSDAFHHVAVVLIIDARREPLVDMVLGYLAALRRQYGLTCFGRKINRRHTHR